MGCAPATPRPPATDPVLSVVVFIVGLVLVGGLLFLGAALLSGRGESQPPADLDRSPVELPDDRPVVGDDVRALQVSVAVRGYRMSEVDWLLDQLARTIDEHDVQIARLSAELRWARERRDTGAHAAGAPENVDAVQNGRPVPGPVPETTTEEIPGA